MSRLILTRRPGEVVDITLLADMPKGTRITVMVGDVVGNQVRLLCGADKNVLIDRHEVTERRWKEEHPDKVSGNVA